MEHPYMWFVKLFEMFGADHFAHTYPHVIYSWVVMVLLIVFCYMPMKAMTMVPTKAQNLLEVIISGIEEFMITVTGEEGRWLFPLAATVFIYILTCNLVGLIPGFYPPTASLNTTASCALVVVIFTHIIGVKYHGVAYVKHFMGPVWWMVPLIFPIEVIGHVARILSLSFRLFGNMMGHELVLGILFFLAGAFFAPLPIMALGIFVAFVQAFVFFLLTIMYFTGAMEHAH
ncbi:MAG: ATP synthase F0 subunit A [Desulfobacteraceae bacterium 4572_88]|nr:MAG: ATP synthase F0 subunit A [Desulfobacteraceae bacterium 4572_88]